MDFMDQLFRNKKWCFDREYFLISFYVEKGKYFAEIEFKI